MKKIIVLDCYEKGITPHRDKAFQDAFEFLQDLEWEYIRYKDLVNPSRYQQLMQSDGFIISGSQLNVPDLPTQKTMEDLIRLVKIYHKPILGICFGHQLIGHIFGCEVRQMEDPKIEWDAEITLTCNPPFALLDNQTIEVDVHHAFEIRYVPELEDIFILHASSAACKVEVITHRERPIYGVQFHPETYKTDEMIKRGEKLLRKFVDLC